MNLNLFLLNPRVGFVVTNLETDSRAVVRSYKRGTAEQWIKEGKQGRLVYTQLDRGSKMEIPG